MLHLKVDIGPSAKCIKIVSNKTEFKKIQLSYITRMAVDSDSDIYYNIHSVLHHCLSKVRDAITFASQDQHCIVS